MNEQQWESTWPTTMGSVCVVVGGLLLFGGCLSLTGMSSFEQLHTATMLPGAEANDALMEQLAAEGPPRWVAGLAGLIRAVLSLILIGGGMGLLQRRRRSPRLLLIWSVVFIIVTITMAAVQWAPRWSLVQESVDAHGLFLAEALISMPLYLALPVIMLIVLRRASIRHETEGWS